MRTSTLALLGAGSYLAARAFARYYRHMDLRDQTVLVTGGSRGLGLVLARELARRGANVAICARDGEELQRAEEDLRQRGARVFTTVCDITHRDQVEDMIGRVRGHFGRIDALINNAGVIEVGPMEVMTLRDYEEAMKTHFWGPLYSTLAVLPEMQRRKAGRIVNISSIGGKISVPHLLPYSASKFALAGFSEGLRSELLKDGIYVTTVIPGLMRTGSPRNATFKGQHRLEYAWFSISDSMPLISMGAERAASQIVRAMQSGDAELTLSLPAKLAVTFHGVFPGLTSDILGLTNELLPGPGGIGRQRAKGLQSESAVSPSPLTMLTEAAAARNNEMGQMATAR